MSAGAYLTGCAGVAVAVIACGMIGTVGRRVLLPSQHGPVAWLAVIVTGVAGALLPAMVLGSFGLLAGWSWLLVLVITAGLLWRFRERLPSCSAEPQPDMRRSLFLLTGAGITIAAAAFGLFAGAAASRLGTGMTVFDTNWYHGPLAVEMALTGDTFSLHQLTPAFLSWFYPQNSELLHSLGILMFGNDLLSPFINVAWFGGCLLAAWAIGRPYGAGPISLAGVALILGSGAMADQAGEARNDIVGAFFVLAGLAFLVNSSQDGRRVTAGPAVLIGLSAGLLAGTKVNFIPAGVLLIVAAIWLSAPGRRRPVAVAAIGSGLAAGGYWYLRNLVHSGNPLPWIRDLGPVTLPGPGQGMGGRPAGSVASYIGDPDVIGHWFFTGLNEAFGAGWPVVLLIALAGLAICLPASSDRGRRAAAVIGLALFFAWFFAPTSASGFSGVPGGFFTGLRYLAPALLAGMALLGAGVGSRRAGVRLFTMGLLLLLSPFVLAAGAGALSPRIAAVALAAGLLSWVAGLAMFVRGRAAGRRAGGPAENRGLAPGVALALVVLVVVAAGLPVQRYYFAHRYTTADYTTRGLEAAFRWARGIEGERIGTTASRQYPLFGVTLGNRVGYVGEPKPRGGYVTPPDCRSFREAVNRGRYRYLVLAVDRITPDSDFPPQAPWISPDPAAKRIYRGEGTVIYRLDGPLDPASCR